MRRARFKGPLLEGHKEDAVEVPFNPEVRWYVPARALWPGRRGHPVQGTLNGKSFDSFVVGRSRKFYVLVSGDIRKAAKIAIGDIVDLALQPQEDSESTGRSTRSSPPGEPGSAKGSERPALKESGKTARRRLSSTGKSPKRAAQSAVRVPSKNR